MHKNFLGNSWYGWYVYRLLNKELGAFTWVGTLNSALSFIQILLEMNPMNYSHDTGISKEIKLNKSTKNKIFSKQFTLTIACPDTRTCRGCLIKERRCLKTRSIRPALFNISHQILCNWRQKIMGTVATAQQQCSSEDWQDGAVEQKNSSNRDGSRGEDKGITLCWGGEVSTHLRGSSCTGWFWLLGDYN